MFMRAHKVKIYCLAWLEFNEYFLIFCKVKDEDVTLLMLEFFPAEAKLK